MGYGMTDKELKRAAFVRIPLGVAVIGGIFFLPAGTLRYWQAWLFMATVFIPMILATAYFLRHDPEVLERRMKAREERDRQKTVQKLGAVIWLGVFILPGLDHRFEWSSVPAPLVIVSALLVLAGYVFVFFTLRENRFASRTIRVEEGQTVITTGPYALVRHPMYLGVLAMFLFSPLALGSYWALIPALFMPVFLALRILDEEKALGEELPGYREYTQKTRKRLIPGIW
jgi:protein-S-isoprenylcysteine O-methyltransferase Ste14